MADKGALVHDGTQGYGENLASASSSEPIGHFTQLVWKGSTKIGAGRVCGTEDNTWHDTYIAVNFSPAGNMAGAYKDNVLRSTQ